MATDFNALFGPMKLKEPEERKNSVPEFEYRVSYKDGKNGTYASIVRFVPYYKNVEENITSKRVSWLMNPVTKQKRPIDNPSTVGDRNNVISAMYWKFRNSGSQFAMDMAEKCLSTSQQYASIIQILKDEQHPELEGRLMVFRYGKKIYDKIMEEYKPAYGDGVNPFDIFEGRLFLLNVGSLGGNNNYDQSKFLDIKGTQSGLRYKNSKGETVVADADASDKNEIIAYLEQESPDLSLYAYHPWDDDTTQFVNDTLAAVNNCVSSGYIPQVTETAIGGGLSANAAPVFPGVSVKPEEKPAQAKAPVMEAVIPEVKEKPAEKKQASNGNGFGDIDDLLAGI